MTTTQHFQPGDAIYRKGDESNAAYLIQSGQVTLEGPQGIKTIGPGHLFGDVELVHEHAREESAHAAEAATVMAYSADELEALLAQSPKEIQQVLLHLANGATAPASAPVAAQNNSADAFAQGLERLTRILDERCTAMEDRLAATPAAPARQTREEDEGDDTPASLRSDGETEKLTEQLKQELSDLGSIMPLLDDDSVDDILINGHGQIYVERRGKLEATDITYENDAAVREVAEKIVRSIGRKIDRRRPLVDARLLDGSRVNIIAPPLAVDGTTISIRKFAKKRITMDVMREQNNVSPQLGDFLRICGRVRLNIVISGGTGAGKTTLLNAVSQSIDHSERVVTIEDAAELQLQQPHVVRLETKPITSGASRREEVTMRDLVKNALRMRPDRILVGEVRGPEAFDMMQAMNTGHEGSLTTIHANHPRDALSRLENMMAMANLNIPHKSIRYQMASAINLVIQVSRMRDGHRRITHVCEIVGMEGEVITMQDLFVYNIDGEEKDGSLRGQFRWTGIMPRFLRRVAYYGEADNLSQALGVKLPKF